MNHDQTADQMRASFEAGLHQRIARSSRVNLQNIIPSHWFSAAASECYSMYIDGHFYGTISIAQAYVESLSKYLCELYGVRGGANDAVARWTKLRNESLVNSCASDSAIAVLSDRNDFHHLNKIVEQDCKNLEKRAEACVNLLHKIESDIFSHSFDAGRVVPVRPERWPDAGEGLIHVHLRNKS